MPSNKTDPGNATTWRRARDGAIVGQMARELLGSEVIWPRGEGSPEDTARTAAALLTANPSLPGVEITLVRENLSARADALIPAQGGYVLQETKASTFGDNPYPCPFFSHCSALDPPGPEHPIELLPGLAGKNLARKLRETRGYTSLLEPAPEELSGNDAALYRRMQRAHRSGEAVLEADSRVALTQLPWPRYYLDFEGIDLPVPRWVGVRPCEQMPFQWSCHIEHESGGFEHREFLDLSGEDPSLPCIAALLQAIPPDGVGPIFVYFKTYEEFRLRELGERLVDLLPLVKASYYHPAMRGSFSVKKVLPTIAPDLDYAELGGVMDGTAAQVAYLYAVFEAGTKEKKEEYRRELLRYCEQDTWAMVEVAWHLQRKGRPAVRASR